MSTITPEGLVDHLTLLVDRGLLPATIDQLAHVTPGTTSRAFHHADDLPYSDARRLWALPAPPAAEHILFRLIAAGYTLRWLSTAHPAAAPLALLSMVDGNPVHITAADAVHALARQLGDKIATPRPGLTVEQIERARAWGRSQGFAVPAMYDDADVAPTKPPTVKFRDKTAEYDEMLDLTWSALTVWDRHNSPRIAAEVLPKTRSLDSRRRTMDRLGRRCGIRASDPDGPARRAHMLRVLSDYRTGRLGSSTAVALALGLVDTKQIATANPAHAEAAELAHLNPFVAVPITDTMGAVA